MHCDRGNGRPQGGYREIVLIEIEVVGCAILQSERMAFWPCDGRGHRADATDSLSNVLKELWAARQRMMMKKKPSIVQP